MTYPRPRAVISFALVVVGTLTGPVRTDAGTVELPRTGQTRCWDPSLSEIPCPGTGQDGDVLAGVAWPEPRFLDHGDGTTTKLAPMEEVTALWAEKPVCPASEVRW